MRDWLITISAQVQKYWRSFTVTQRIVVSVLAGLIVFSLLGFTFWMTKPEYSVLYSNLSSEDASAVINKLKEMKVEYQITGNGNTITVPNRKVYELRLNMAGEGIPQGGGVGFEIFDKNFFGMTEFTQTLNYQRALQGELERTIRQIQGVEGARVHLVIPKQELFVEDKKDPTASVLLKLSPRTKLTKQQVKAIVNLVKTSVEGLSEGNVSVVDTRGTILSDIISDEFMFANTMSDMFGMKRKIEHDIQEEVRVLLEKIVGINRVAVKASIDFNMNKEETTKEEYSPVVNSRDGIIRSEQKNVEYFKGSGSTTGGVPGTTSNISAPGYLSVGTNSGNNSDYTKENNTINYEINKKLSHVFMMPGQVNKISISVILDGEYSPEIMDSLRQVVASGIGIREDRGDKVVVESFKFDKTYLEEERMEENRQAYRELRNLLIKAGVVVFISLMVIIFTTGMIRHFRALKKMAEKVKETQDKIAAAGSNAVNGTGTLTAISPAVVEGIRKQVDEVAKKDPEKIAKVIKIMLSGK